MIGSAAPFIAMAIIISAIVSLIGTGARKRAVEEGRARAAELCELTGIFDPRVLQDVFGPPTMDGIYQVTMPQIRKARMPLGRLISDDPLDMACILVALLTFFWTHPISELLLMIAAAYQTAGWFISTGLPKRS
ncbi:MAG: hypothetical protein CMK09_17960 [Ponticaulis sp.]|nr:hypothetical protein [Ponticaulis sp.]|tara:strand:+ start:20301 stop:20702 length:402 start_codon:yes stop_codon:yes gene_type:complete